MKHLLPWSWIAVAFLGCAGDPSGPAVSVDEAAPEALDGEKADAVSELRVRAGDTTVWTDRDLVRRGDTFVLEGRSSRNLTGGMAFVFDDPYGAFEVVSPRKFEVQWALGEISSLIEGVPQFMRVTMAPSRGRPDDVTARVLVRPRLTRISGQRVYFEPDLVPVVHGGRVMYRLDGTTSGELRSFSVEVAGVHVPDVRPLGPKSFRIDLLREHVLAMTAGGELVVRADLASGPATKRARALLRVRKLALTDGDAYEVWPPVECLDEARTCLAALPPGTADLGSCGEAVFVRPCLGAADAVVTDVEIQAALAAADTRLGAAFLDDAAGLVGPSRAASLAEGAKQAIEDGVVALIGQVFPDAAARDAAFAAVIEAGVDAAYARPLEWVGGAGRRGADRAADALLEYLSEAELESTEYGRSLEVLTRELRSRHVADLRALRATDPEVHGDQEVYIGRWLSTYVEVAVEPSTGRVTHFLFEID